MECGFKNLKVCLMYHARHTSMNSFYFILKHKAHVSTTNCDHKAVSSKKTWLSSTFSTIATAYNKNTCLEKPFSFNHVLLWKAEKHVYFQHAICLHGRVVFDCLTDQTKPITAHNMRRLENRIYLHIRGETIINQKI